MPESINYNISQARTIQHRTEPSRALRTCHIHARVAKTILKWQESSRTSHNHHAVSKSKQIFENQSTGQARIYYYNIKQARTIKHCTESPRTKFNMPQLCKPSHNYSHFSKKYIERSITIIQYLNQERSPKINPQVRPRSTTTI